MVVCGLMWSKSGLMTAVWFENVLMINDSGHLWQMTDAVSGVFVPSTPHTQHSIAHLAWVANEGERVL